MVNGMLTTYKSNVRINKSFEINSKADIFDLCHTKHPAMAFAHIAQNLCPQFMAKVMNFKGKKCGLLICRVTKWLVILLNYRDILNMDS